MIILGLQLGNTGSVSDATCVNGADFLRNVNEVFFTTGINQEYLLANSGYTLHPFVLTPYRRPQVVASTDNFDFNLIHSSARVAVENTIGVLKGRWRLLKNIPIQLNNPAISVCVILHNYLIINQTKNSFLRRI